MVYELIFKGTKMVIPNNRTILETLLSEKVEGVRFMCKQGYCGQCKCKIEGKVEMREEPLVMLQKDEVLPCISYPLSDITIY